MTQQKEREMRMRRLKFCFCKFISTESQGQQLRFAPTIQDPKGAKVQTGANRCFSNFSAKHILEEMKKNVGQVRCSVRRSSQDGASSFPGSPGLKRALGLFGRSFAPEMANGLSWKPLRPSQWPVTQSFLLQVLRFPGVQLPKAPKNKNTYKTIGDAR